MLTPEQRNLAAENHNLIYKFARDKNLDFSEFYDLLAISLCKAAKTFDPSRGVCFSTYAYKCMRSDFKNFIQRIYAQKRGAGMKEVSYDTPICDGESEITILDTISNDSRLGYDFDAGTAEINDFIKTLTKNQARIMRSLLYYGTETDAARSLGCSRQNVSVARRGLQNKWRRYNAD